MSKIILAAYCQNFRADSKNVEIENKIKNYINAVATNEDCKIVFLFQTFYESWLREEAQQLPVIGTYTWNLWSGFTRPRYSKTIAATNIQWSIPFDIQQDIGPIDSIEIIGPLNENELISLCALLRSYFETEKTLINDFYGVARNKEYFKSINIEIK